MFISFMLVPMVTTFRAAIYGRPDTEFVPTASSTDIYAGATGLWSTL